MKRIKFIFIFVIGFYSSFFSQLVISQDYGFNVGLISSFGTHFQRFGVVVQGYALRDFTQINASLRIYNNFKNIGPKIEHAEAVGSIGFCVGYGKKNNEQNTVISCISNQTKYKNSIAYSYNLYFNKIKTTQVTGIISLQFNRVSVITENDLLAKPTLDRFRTGAFLFQYQYKNFQYAINCTMWTGQMGSGVRNDTLFPGVGYLNDNGGLYSNLSHGLLSAQIKCGNEFGQYLQSNFGIDDERVRNAVQNKMIHDMPFIPNKWNKSKNLHIPMIDTEGSQYLYRKGQKIQKTKVYFNQHLSPNIFY